MAYFNIGSQITKTEYHYGFKFQHRYEVINGELIIVRVFSANHELVFKQMVSVEHTTDELFEVMDNTILSWIDENTNEVDALMVELLQGNNKPYDFKIKTKY